MIDIQSLVDELNENAYRYNIGGIQDLRKALRGLYRRPGSSIFSSKSTFDNYAFHHGGRTELQFNIGFDGSNGKLLRHGIAFSFEPNQTLPDIDVLRPKVRLFNEFLNLYPTKYSNMRMWHWDNDVRSDEYSPSSIPPERIASGVFVFLGKLNSVRRVNCDLILQDFDDLLPLYTYVESNGSTPPLAVSDNSEFEFRPGCTVKKTKTTSQKSGDPTDVSLRHNSLQRKLYKTLVAKFGSRNVGTELPTGNGARVDVVVKRSKKYWFYEIKTYHSPRACIRDAVGQLLEYSHWPNGIGASRLIVVGENPINEDGKQYLSKLKSQYSLPIYYNNVKL